jgi:hypothetical protein
MTYVDEHLIIITTSAQRRRHQSAHKFASVATVCTSSLLSELDQQYWHEDRTPIPLDPLTRYPMPDNVLSSGKVAGWLVGTPLQLTKGFVTMQDVTPLAYAHSPVSSYND